ncbi:MAG: energy transducer TonB, partial [Candidatus Tectomicrobia bacterium]|nr:energy transducer TonB [Candidatus Tectomicrobia bacterium]
PSPARGEGDGRSPSLTGGEKIPLLVDHRDQERGGRNDTSTVSLQNIDGDVKGKGDHRPEDNGAPLGDGGRDDVGMDHRSNASEGDRDSGGTMVPPMTVSLPKPQYPRYSRRHGEEGTVVLSVEIDANGGQRKIQIVSSSGSSRLDLAAVQAVERATFIPAKIGGKGVPSTKRIAFTFKLESPSKEDSED